MTNLRRYWLVVALAFIGTATLLAQITVNGVNALGVVTVTTVNGVGLTGTAGTTMTFPTTSATLARTDAANTFTGVQTMTAPVITTAVTAGSGMAVANVGANSCGTSTATIAGNNNAGEVTVGTVAGTQCRIAFTVTAPVKWQCTASDEVTAVLVRGVPVDTTHADLLGAFTAGDVITYHCDAR